ncbi:hypothetical protein [Inhella sp.]|uniref:hypothetical protein n=1 Tax=Inhella sp. TaxID=1921806 RepID=UPI0035B147E6
MHRPLALVALLALLVPRPCISESDPPQIMPEIALHLQDRPPYYVLKGPAGLVVMPLLQALQRAGLPHRFEHTPALRQLRLIESDGGMHCGVGWFRNEERATKGRFSKALYQDQPLGLLMRQELGWQAPLRMAEALAERRVRLLVKAGFSYGAEFDRQLAALPPPAKITGEMATVARMLAADRADWTPMAPEEAQLLVTQFAGLRMLSFADAPPGGRRHLYCNKAVPEAWLKRLDAELPEIKR